MTRTSHSQNQRKSDWDNSITWVKFRLIFTHVMLFYQLGYRLSPSLSVFPHFCLSLCFEFNLYTDPAEFIQIVSQVQQSPSQKSSWVLKFLLFRFVFCFFSVWPLKKEKKSNYGFFWRLTLSSAGLSVSCTGLQETCTSVTLFFPSGVARGQRMCKTRIGSGKNSTCIKVVAANSLLFTVVHVMTNQVHLITRYHRMLYTTVFFLGLFKT